MIDNVSSLSYLNSIEKPSKNVNSPEKIKDAAQQFEALLIGQLLKTAKASGSSGWLGSGEEDEPGQVSVDMAEQQLASVIAKNGG
jgi:Rod binding domain-containing protein